MDIEEKKDEQIIQPEAETKNENKAKKAFKKLKAAEKGLFNDFKKFISKGNIVQLAVAFIMGAAFTAIVNSLVGDIFMPFFSLIFGKTDISNLKWIISDDLIINYGQFILAVLNFLLISLVLFLIVKAFAKAESGFKKLKKGHPEPPPPAPPEPTKTEQLLTDIKDLLAKQDENKKS